MLLIRGILNKNSVPGKSDSYLKTILRGCMFGGLNSLTTKKQTTKVSSANFSKMSSPSYIILNSKTRGHHEPPHQDLRCLQMELNSSLVLKE